MGKNINEIDNTNLILNGKYITYSVLLQLFLPNVRPVLFVSDPIRCQNWGNEDDMSTIKFMSTP